MKTRTISGDIRICVDKVERVESGRSGKWETRVTAENVAFGLRFLVDDLRDAPMPGDILVIDIKTVVET